MKLYADLPATRTRQLAGDAGVLAWTIVWVLIGRAVYHAVNGLRGAADSVRSAGDRFAGTLGDVADNVQRVPVAGGALKRPFSGAAGAGTSLADAGTKASSSVHSLALWLGVLLALLPVIWLAVKWLPGRIRWAREATAAATLTVTERDIDLLAARAVARQPLHLIARTDRDPRSLAALELRSLGLRGP